MKNLLQHILLFIFAFIQSIDVQGQCTTPQLLGVNNGPSGIQITHEYQQAGTYFIEHGAPGFTPGVDGNAGVGGTLYQVNGFYGVTELLGLSGTNKTYYLRLRCPNLSWTPNSNAITFNASGAAQYGVIYPIFNLNEPNTHYITNNPSTPPVNAMNICAQFGSGNETRYRYDSKGTGYYELELSNSAGYLNPQFAWKPLNGNNAVQNYTCVLPYKTTNISGVQRDYFRVGPFVNGVAYDLSLDPFNSTTFYQVNVKLSCPLPNTITFNNIQPTSVNINKNCGNCADSLIMEYGLKGFTPGTGANPGVNGTIIYFPGQTMTLPSLQVSTEYDLYFRAVCGPVYTSNVKYSIRTAINCATVPGLNCGDFGNFTLLGSNGQRGAWASNYCSAPVSHPDSAMEMLYSFTPTSTGNYSLYSYKLIAGHTGFVYTTKLQIKDAALGCNELNWTCLTSLTGNPITYVPQTISLGILTAGTTYLIRADKPFGSVYTSIFYFQLKCNPDCFSPVLDLITNVNPTGATVNLFCNTCYPSVFLEYGPAGFSPGADTLPGVGGTVIMNPSFPYVLSGLNSNMTYDVYARTNCNGSGSGFTSNAGPQNFTTCSTAPTSITKSYAASFACTGDSVTLYRQGGVLSPGSEFKWYSGGCGLTYLGSGDSIRVLVPNQNINYSVRAEGSCGISGCANFSMSVFTIAINGTTSICEGNSANINVTTNGLLYNWSTGATTQSININQPGTYTCTAYSATFGCYATANKIVGGLVPVASSVNASCTSLCDGSASVTVSGGTAPYTYLWNNGATTSSLNNLCAGNYSVSTSDAAGCLINRNVVVSAPPCLSCTKPDQLSVSNINPSNAMISWNPGIVADKFQVRYRLSTSSVYDFVSVSGPNPPNFVTLYNLTPSSTYIWQVKSICSTGNSIYSDESTFTTLSGQLACNTTPQNPGHGIINPTNAQLIWGAQTADNFKVRYLILGSPNWTWATFPSIPNNGNILGNLLPGTTYVWQVRTSCSGGSNSTFSMTDTFTTGSGSLLCASTPINLGSTNITNSSAMLNWAMQSADNFKVRYRLMNSSNWIWQTFQSWANTGGVLGGLNPGTTYIWQLRTSCTGGTNSGFSETDTFTTLPFLLREIDVTSNTFHVYPNPFSQKLYLDLASDDENSDHTIEIFDLPGTKVYTQKFKGNNLELDLKGISSGVYLLKISTSGSTHYKRIVKL